MSYLYIKALHIIFIVTWFSGLFYIVRIFIYQTEANEKEEPARSILIQEYQRNARRLWLGITWPSAVLTFVFGISLLIAQPQYLEMPFMHVKLALVVFLYIYHFACHALYKKLQKGYYKYGSQRLRAWNEVATLFLVAIVFLIVLKSTLNMFWALIAFILFAVVLFVAIRIYKNQRLRNEKSED